MVRPLARTPDEALLYFEIRPCECGETSADWSNALTHDEGWPARRYYTTCPACGSQREFVFRLPERPLLPPPGTQVLFGGSEHSELIDAGEWLWIADQCARGVRPVTDEDDRRRLDADGRAALEMAIAAMDEVLKFIPEGEPEVPAEAFWTDKGREVRRRERGRFQRDRLGVVGDSYRQFLHTYR